MGITKPLAIVLMILSALFGVTLGEIIDDKIVIPILEKPAEVPAACPEALILAYTEDEKYICKCIGPECPCKSSEEILSELG